MKTIATFELRPEHYKKALEQTEEDLLCEYYQTHCALAVAAREAGLEVAVTGVNVKYKRSYYRLSRPAEWLMSAFDTMSRDRNSQGLDYVLGRYTPTLLPATIMLIKVGDKSKAVRAEELAVERSAQS